MYLLAFCLDALELRFVSLNSGVCVCVQRSVTFESIRKHLCVLCWCGFSACVGLSLCD